MFSDMHISKFEIHRNDFRGKFLIWKLEANLVFTESIHKILVVRESIKFVKKKTHTHTQCLTVCIKMYVGVI